MVDGLTRDRDPIFDGMVYETNVKFSLKESSCDTSKRDGPRWCKKTKH